MIGIESDAVGLLHFRASLRPGLAGAGVYIKAWVVARSEGGTDAVTLIEDDAGGPAIDGDFLNLTGR
jgi:hypothetical protein